MNNGEHEEDTDYDEGWAQYEALARRYYQEEIAFRKELHDLGRTAADKWVETASCKDVLYVKTAIIDNPDICRLVNLDTLADDPIIGKHIRSLSDSEPLLAGFHSTYMLRFSRTAALAWLEGVNNWCWLMEDYADYADKLDEEGEEGENASPSNVGRKRRKAIA